MFKVFDAKVELQESESEEEFTFTNEAELDHEGAAGAMYLVLNTSFILQSALEP